MKISISIFMVSFFFLISCERKCYLTPIPKSVVDLDKVEKKIVVTNGNETDSLILLEKEEDYVKNSFRGPMKVVDCQDYKSYRFNFKKNYIDVILRKFVEDTIELDVSGFAACFRVDDTRMIPEKELQLNKEYVFERDSNCDTSIVKKIVLKGYLIKSITTSDNKTWIVK